MLLNPYPGSLRIGLSGWSGFRLPDRPLVPPDIQALLDGFFSRQRPGTGLKIDNGEGYGTHTAVQLIHDFDKSLYGNWDGKLSKEELKKSLRRTDLTYQERALASELLYNFESISSRGSATSPHPDFPDRVATIDTADIAAAAQLYGDWSVLSHREIRSQDINSILF